MLNSVVKLTMKSLMSKLWPGPITFVLRKNSGVLMLQRGGLRSCGQMLPSRARLLRSLRRQAFQLRHRVLTSPANRSPTTFEDAAEDMDGQN